MKRMIRLILCFTIALLLCLQRPSLSQSLSQAQNLDAQAQQQLARGNADRALKSWQQAETLYSQFNRPTEALGTQLNQAKAMQALGFYRRAKALLEKIQTPLLQQPNSSLKANGLLTLGNVLRLVGEFDRSQSVIEQSLAIAAQMNSKSDLQAAHFQLGNTLLAQQKLEAALAQFQQASEISSEVQLPARLHELKILLQLGQRSQAEQLVPKIRSHFATLPLNSTTIYARIEFADSLAKLASLKSAAELLAIAVQQAQQLRDRRAESYALGRLASLYEQSQQWTEAQRLNQKALTIAEEINAPDLLYQWQWQRGRLWENRGEIQRAIANYTNAVKSLRVLRSDLLAVASDVQFSFREQVEPVYRELVGLLLQQGSEANLIQARDVIESLQLEELNNFFREACLTAVSRQVDQVDQTAAVFYPIILNDRLEVVVSLPKGKLKHYTTVLSRAEIEAGIDRMLQAMRSTSFEQERLSAGQELYRWLIQPATEDLAQQSIKTLVFVLDGSLRSVPMAALHSGQHYLIEQYAIALTPSLQLLSPQPLPDQTLSALVAGLSEANQGSVALPGVEKEINQIQKKVDAIVLENESFTSRTLKQKLRTQPFSVVHLATHGQFGSTFKETFIQTWDGRVSVEDLRTYLTQRDVPDSAAIELLVLSACQTAQGDDRAALGMAGVAIRSGARSTLASLWMVNDASTAQFVTQFYQGLTRDRRTRAEAVRQAQLTLLNSSRFSHPYYWAAFTLIGNWL